MDIYPEIKGPWWYTCDMGKNIQNVHMGDFLSPRQLAKAVGVSESSVKRWADAGSIRTTVTAGGHRRIPLREAVRFLRETQQELVLPELLGLADFVPRSEQTAGGTDERLFDHLKSGRSAEAIGMLQSLYLGGAELAQIVDGPFSGALDRLGKLWLSHAEEGIYWEHRATQICQGALHQLQALQVGQETTGLSALGGAVEGDPYVLPSLAVSAVLESVGFTTTNLGPATPLNSLCAAIREQRPDLVWVSVTSKQPAKEMNRGIDRLLQEVGNVEGAVVVGGQQSAGIRAGSRERLFHCGSMSELAAFARGLARGR